MRIALVVERFQPAGGGVERVVWNLARQLATGGDEVHVVAREGEETDGIRLVRVPVPRFWQPLRVLAFSRAAHRATRGTQFDVVHAFARTRHQDVFHAGGGCHADYMESTYGSAGARLRRLSPRHALALALERRILGDETQTIQCVSRRGADELRRRYAVPEARLVVVACGVDAERFDRDRWRAEGRLLRESLGGDRDRGPVWLFAGSGWRRKGLDTALRALARTASSAHRLWIVGSDDPAPWIERARRLGVADRARFLGPRDDMEQVFAASDALLFPTRYDGFGLVCLEAAASGLAQVVSARAGAAELVAEAGRVIDDPEDAGAFARAMDTLLEPESREPLGRRGRQIAEAHTWSHCAEQMRALYRFHQEARQAW